MDNLVLGRIREILEGILFQLKSAFPIGSSSATSANQTTEIAAVNETIRLLKGGTGSIAQIQTAATGSNYTALGTLACYQVCFSNNTGQDISVRYVGQTIPIVVFAGTMMTFDGITNTNQLEIKRTDSSNTQVTIQYTTNS